MAISENDLFDGYGIDLRSGVDRIAQAHASEAALIERITELVAFRKWYRRQPRFDVWMDLAVRNDIVLRELLTIARKARKAVAPDPIDDAKRYADWTPGELIAGFGK